MPSCQPRPPRRGVIPPLVTPLAAGGSLDVAGLERLVERVLGGGVDGLFLLGSTGEGPCLAGPLRRELVERACSQVNRRVPVLVGVSDTAVAESVALARHAADCGADAVVATTPYYFKPGPAEVAGYFTSLAREVPLPLYLYNMPGLTGTVIEPSVVRRLMDEPGIAGIKDSSGDLEYFGRLVSLAGERGGWGVFMGREELGVQALAMGAHGVVPGGANLLPRLHADALAAVTARDSARAEALNIRITEIASAVFTLGSRSVGFIQGLKAALSMAGVCGDLLAPPFPPLSGADREALRQRLIALNVLSTVDGAGVVAAPR